LFHVLDQEGKGNGHINQEAFLRMANRMGLNLTSHRIKEIFAKIKGNKLKADSAELELTMREFEHAFIYLQEKNILKGLELLGVTPEMLFTAFVQLLILLLLVFVFIFVGIQAFTVGGVFGSIVTSAFPALGGYGVSNQSKSEDKEKMDASNIKEAADTGFEITTSDDL